MTHGLLVLVLLALLAVIGMLATGVRGGPLDPPGPPGSTDGVRQPGTPISSLPFAITQGGYYYVTRPLSGGAGQQGISISASNVTLDLGGFTVTGASIGFGDGISTTGGRNVIIRNGAVRNWLNGINALATNSRVDHVQAISNGNIGIKIGVSSEINDCNASINAIGIDGDRLVVRRCTITENSLYGISVVTRSLIEDSRVNVNQGEAGIRLLGNNNVVRTNVATENAQFDIRILGNDNDVFENTYCSSGNFGLGNVLAGNVDGC